MRLLKNAYAYSGVLATALTLGTASVAQATSGDLQIQPGGSPTGGFTAGGSSFKDIAGTLGKQIIDIILVVAGVLAVVYLVYNGIKYITSSGNPDAVKAARSGVINAIIGIIIIAGAYYLVQFAVNIGGGVGQNLTGGTTTGGSNNDSLPPIE